jgi:hypothetical protein
MGNDFTKAIIRLIVMPNVLDFYLGHNLTGYGETLSSYNQCSSAVVIPVPLAGPLIFIPDQVSLIIRMYT